MLTPILESELRHSLLARLHSSPRAPAAVVEEFSVDAGRSRVDVVCVGAHLEGFEIKSDKDNFNRFPNQIHSYNRVFDRITLVIGPALEDAAMYVVPDWWGLLIAKRRADGSVQLVSRRRAKSNPSQEPFSVASLLTKNEAMRLLRESSIDVERKSSLYTIWNSLSEALTLDALKRAVRESLSTRFDYTSPR